MYELKLFGTTMLRSPIPLCGYTPERLRKILAAGYEYYCDGKRIKRV